MKTPWEEFLDELTKQTQSALEVARIAAALRDIDYGDE